MRVVGGRTVAPLGDLQERMEQATSPAAPIHPRRGEAPGAAGGAAHLVALRQHRAHLRLNALVLRRSVAVAAA